jgi:subtilase family serine protease
MISSADGSYRAGVCAGSWIVDALTENTVNRSVPTQTAVLTDGQTVTLNFIADVTPPTLSINSVTSPTTASSQTISGAMEAGATLRISVNTAAVAGAISYPTATTWSCVISGLVSGINSITVTAIDSSENTTSAPVNITLTPYPDLIVTSVAVPTNAVTGQSITIPVTIRNQGNTTANSFYTMLYLSSDNAITSGDTALSSIFVASLAPGTQQTLSHTFTVPTVAAKNYYFGAIVDCDSKVGESSETNNSLAGSPTAISYGPDLIVTAVTPPSNAVTGQSITIPVTIKNQGSTTANSFYTMIYLSADSAIIGSDTALSSIFVASLAPGAQQTLNYTFTVPSVAAKNYYFGAIVDCDNRVGESSETNNSLAGSPTTISSGPDLIVTAVTPPSNAVTGQSITIPVMIKNQGSTTANSFYTMIYLSADSTITASDTALSSLFVASLAPGAQQTLTYTVTVPAVAAGNYYFGAIVDCDNRVGESSETNNSLAGSPTAISYGPDLIVTAVTPPSNAVTGQSITMPVTIKNQGSTSANYFYTTLYLSTDSAITTADSYLGNVSTMSPLAPGAQVTMNYTVVVPSVTAGNYYIGAIVDYDNRIGESSEINNSLAGSPTMIGYGPDLTITTLTPPATTTTGQQITIPVLIKNQGSTVANYFFTRLYLSMDNSITSSDTYLGEIFVSSLAPGTQQTLNYTFTTPNMASGTYYFGAITDATNTVGESDEANNTLATTATAIN